MDVLTQYLIELTPAVTAVIGIVVALIVGIKKIKAANKETVDDVKATNKQMREANEVLMRQNLELKDTLEKTIKEIKHIREA